MRKELGILGLNEKEAVVYLYLIEYGVSPASEISKRVGIPKSTVNFIADNLWERWMIKKSFQGKTGYYEADINMLEYNIYSEAEKKKKILWEILPLLQEKKFRNYVETKNVFFWWKRYV